MPLVSPAELRPGDRLNWRGAVSVVRAVIPIRPGTVKVRCDLPAGTLRLPTAIPVQRLADRPNVARSPHPDPCMEDL